MTELAPSIYQLKVTLMLIEPPIWRRLQLRADSTFHDLHNALQIAMGWQNYHLHQFEVGDTILTDAQALNGYGDRDWVERMRDDLARLDEYLTQEGQTFLYEYDFGDGWQHELLLEKIVSARENSKYPRCLGGERACPPEDVGGVGGYAIYLGAVADPEHEGHESYLDWRGPFDPEAFSVKKINRQFRYGVRWEGELVMAPLASTRSFTSPAQALWDEIPEHEQARLLGLAWCDKEGKQTTLVDFEGKIRQGNLRLDGRCVRCGGRAMLEIVIE